MFVETEKNIVNLDLVNEIYIEENQIKYGYTPARRLLILGEFQNNRDAQKAYQQLKDSMVTGKNFVSIKNCKGFISSRGWFE